MVGGGSFVETAAPPGPGWVRASSRHCLALEIAFIGALNPGNLASGWAHPVGKGDFGPCAALATGLGLGWLAVILYLDAFISPAGTGLIYAGTPRGVPAFSARTAAVPGDLPCWLPGEGCISHPAGQLCSMAPLDYLWMAPSHGTDHQRLGWDASNGVDDRGCRADACRWPAACERGLGLVWMVRRHGQQPRRL